MSKFYNFSLCALRTTMFLLFIGNTSHAFAPVPNQLSFVRDNSNGSSKIIPTKKIIQTNDASKTLRRRKTTSLSAFSLVQLASHASTVVPKSILLMKDLSGPLSSIITADPDAEAEFLLDISHLLLDFTAFYKFDGKFLNCAQIAGRISFILIDFLPGHAFNWEEMAVQLVLLGISLQRMMPDQEEEEATEEVEVEIETLGHITPIET